MSFQEGASRSQEQHWNYCREPRSSGWARTPLTRAARLLQC